MSVALDQVVMVLERLRAAGLRVCVQGGWGVDALLGEQTRPHLDLDLAIDAERARDAEAALARHGFRHDTAARPGLPARLVLKTGLGTQVDVHPLHFDARGNGWQQLTDAGGWLLHPADDLWANGELAGQAVLCITPGLQLRFRLGYVWTDRDWHDVRLLHERFDVPLPPDAIGAPG